MGEAIHRQNGGGGAFHKQRSGGKSVDSLRILRVPVALRQKRCCGMTTAFAH